MLTSSVGNTRNAIRAFLSLPPEKQTSLVQEGLQRAAQREASGPLTAEVTKSESETADVISEVGQEALSTGSQKAPTFPEPKPIPDELTDDVIDEWFTPEAIEEACRLAPDPHPSRYEAVRQCFSHHEYSELGDHLPSLILSKTSRRFTQFLDQPEMDPDLRDLLAKYPPIFLRSSNLRFAKTFQEFCRERGIIEPSSWKDLPGFLEAFHAIYRRDPSELLTAVGLLKSGKSEAVVINSKLIKACQQGAPAQLLPQLADAIYQTSHLPIFVYHKDPSNMALFRAICTRAGVRYTEKLDHEVSTRLGKHKYFSALKLTRLVLNLPWFKKSDRSFVLLMTELHPLHSLFQVLSQTSDSEDRMLTPLGSALSHSSIQRAITHLTFPEEQIQIQDQLYRETFHKEPEQGRVWNFLFTLFSSKRSDAESYLHAIAAALADGGEAALNAVPTPPIAHELEEGELPDQDTLLEGLSAIRLAMEPLAALEREEPTPDNCPTGDHLFWEALRKRYPDRLETQEQAKALLRIWIKNARKIPPEPGESVLDYMDRITARERRSVPSSEAKAPIVHLREELLKHFIRPLWIEVLHGRPLTAIPTPEALAFLGLGAPFLPIEEELHRLKDLRQSLFTDHETSLPSSFRSQAINEALLRQPEQIRIHLLDGVQAYPKGPSGNLYCSAHGLATRLVVEDKSYHTRPPKAPPRPPATTHLLDTSLSEAEFQQGLLNAAHRGGQLIFAKRKFELVKTIVETGDVSALLRLKSSPPPVDQHGFLPQESDYEYAYSMERQSALNVHYYGLVQLISLRLRENPSTEDTVTGWLRDSFIELSRGYMGAKSDAKLRRWVEGVGFPWAYIARPLIYFSNPANCEAKGLMPKHLVEDPSWRGLHRAPGFNQCYGTLTLEKVKILVAIVHRLDQHNRECFHA